MKKPLMACLILAGASLMLCLAAGAQEVPWHSYAAKFVCGSIERGPTAVGVDGKYKTTVNVHNPNYLEDLILQEGGGITIPVTFFKKIVLAAAQGDEPIRPSCFKIESLQSDYAMHVNCNSITKQLLESGTPLPSSGVLEGYVVFLVPPFQGIESPEPPELDVTAFYTARSRAYFADIRMNGVGTWDVENVDFKVVRGSPEIEDVCSDPGFDN